MEIITGTTIYEIIKSFDAANNPVVPASFSYEFYINGLTSLTPSLNISLSDATNGSYTASFSSNTVGVHQFSVKNNTTSVIYCSNIYEVVYSSSTPSLATIYVGL